MPLTDNPKTVGVIGGGQLCRMMAESASPLGVEIVFLDPAPNAPARPVSRDQIVAEFDDPSGLRELIDRTDCITYDIELADPEMISSIDPNVPVHPAPETLHMIEDKRRQKNRLQKHDIPVPRFRSVDSVADVQSAGEEFGYPLMLKSRTGGYDGRGNLRVDSETGIENALDELEGSLMAEEFISYDRELSVIGAKNSTETTVYPVTETVHEEQILRHSVTPARTTDEIKQQARSVAKSVLAVMDGHGVYGIELFEREGDILVNEIAPRPHNSGHWTIEGATTSQFEQHIRAVLDLPLGSTNLEHTSVTVNILGEKGERPVRLEGVGPLLEEDGVHLHWYGKDTEWALRKLGHYTVTGTDPDQVEERALNFSNFLRFQP